MLDDSPVDVWELCYLPDFADTTLTVLTRQISLAGVPAEFADSPWLRANRSLWDRAEPITIHREFNWQTGDATKPWDRLYAGWTNGRHRVAIARKLAIEELQIVVLGFAFWPPGTRPPDRQLVPKGQSCFRHPDFDAGRAKWRRWPADDRGTPAACDGQ